MSTSGAPGVSVAGNTVLDRVGAIEAELQRLTAKTEELDNRVNRIVADGTNRIADLEFRLVELEGGDVSQLGETTTLGGATAAAPAAAPAPAQPPAAAAPGTQLAMGEQADFDTAESAYDAGDYASAATRFEQFNLAYPGSPLAARAHLLRGRALEAQGDTREAARAYLAGFSSDPDGAVAPQALYELGAALGILGQTEQACLTLGEVGNRFPGSPSVAEAQAKLSELGCL
jgi:tol-pal system protein YbgF